MKRLGVLRGGRGENYETSLREGGDFISYVIENLSEKWKPVDILIDRDGVWHLAGRPVLPSDLAHKVDVVWSTTNPSFSQVLENFSISHIKAGEHSSFLGKSKNMLREHMQKIGINLPRHIILPAYLEELDGNRQKYAQKKAKEVFEKFSGPWVVKSLTADSDMAIHIARTFDNLVDAIEDGVSHGTSTIIEELIPGKNVETHSIAKFRGEDIYILPLQGLSMAEKEKINSLLKDLYRHLGAKHYLKSDFIISPGGQVYLSNIKFSPDLRKDSHFCKSCESIGSKPHQVIEHMLESF